MTPRKPLSKSRQITSPDESLVMTPDHGERLAKMETEVAAMWREMERIREVLESALEGVKEVPGLTLRVSELTATVKTLNDSMRKFNSWLDRGLGAKGLVTLVFAVAIGAAALVSAWKTVHDWFVVLPK